MDKKPLILIETETSIIAFTGKWHLARVIDSTADKAIYSLNPDRYTAKHLISIFMLSLNILEYVRITAEQLHERNTPSLSFYDCSSYTIEYIKKQLI